MYVELDLVKLFYELRGLWLTDRSAQPSSLRVHKLQRQLQLVVQLCIHLKWRCQKLCKLDFFVIFNWSTSCLSVSDATQLEYVNVAN
jgi:hypothetical protein